jgi:hypothetical protein
MYKALKSILDCYLELILHQPPKHLKKQKQKTDIVTFALHLAQLFLAFYSLKNKKLGQTQF